MLSYAIPLVPGPVRVPAEIRAIYQTDFGSADMETEFFELYGRCEQGLQQILATENPIAILSGEGMLALWSALKSVIRPGDRVLAVATGVFGYGIADMARQIGAEVEVVGVGYDGIADADVVAKAAQRFRPRLITAVHCETPSGTLNPLAELGSIARAVDALFYVDFVASAGGVAVDVDRCHIDLGLLGSQKVLSLLPDLSMVSVSARAWEAIEATGYVGYDALGPWRTAVADRYLPYTHNWHSMAALDAAVRSLLTEGLEAVYARHAQVAATCRRRVQEIGMTLWPADDAYAAPTVTAARLPAGWSWPALDEALRKQGMVIGGSYGPMADKVVRFGHMGAQADPELMAQAMDVLAATVAAGPASA
ncbi:MAG: aminotransferase class V-fold PLP-dependent enzyme [Litorilinea sp.]